MSADRAARALHAAAMLALGLCVASHALAADAVRTFDRDSLRVDVDVLQQAFETLHPGLHRYNTPARMRARFGELRRELDGPRTLEQTFLALSRFTAAIRCGHTFPNPTNQKRAVRERLFEGGRRVPFEFRWLGDRMVVTRDLTATSELTVGTEIVAIDGMRVGRLLARLVPMVRADGGNDAKRVALLEVQGLERYETFDVLLPFVAPRLGATMRLDTRGPDGTSKRVTVPGLTYAQRQAARHAASDDSTKGWTFRIEGDGLAVLRMPDWALYDSKWDWKGFIDSAFARMHAESAVALAIDLRGNEGGLDCGDAILPHLIADSLAIAEVPRHVRYRRVPAELEPFLDTWDASFKDWGSRAIPDRPGFYRLESDDESAAGPKIAPRAPRFRGPVFVLVDASNSSATFQFAQTVKAGRLATLVGQPTGGNQRGINGGAFFFLRLPHSGLEVDLPLIARFPGDRLPDAGVTPDVPVRATARDLASGVDVELRAVRDLLANRGR